MKINKHSGFVFYPLGGILLAGLLLYTIVIHSVSTAIEEEKHRPKSGQREKKVVAQPRKEPKGRSKEPSCGESNTGELNKGDSGRHDSSYYSF